MNEHYQMRPNPLAQTAVVLSGVAGVFRRRWPFALAIVLGIVILSVLAVRILPARYEASATLWLRGPASADAPAEAKFAERQQSLVQELRSTSLALTVVEALHLETIPEYRAALPETPQAWESLAVSLLGQKAADLIVRTVRPVDAPIAVSDEEKKHIRNLALAKAFLDKLSVSVEGTERVRVAYRGREPRFSYQALNALLEAFHEGQVTAKLERQEQAITVLRKRIDYLRKRLDDPSRILLQADSIKLVELENDNGAARPDAVVSVAPVLPTRPVAPPLRLVLALSIVAGLAIAIAIILILELRAWVRQHAYDATSARLQSDI